MCEIYRIPHSHYLGGELCWTPLDREKAEAYLAWKNSACSGCGTRAEEWDPEQGGNRHKYIGGTERCVGCETLELERAGVPDDAKGIKLVLLPNPRLVDDPEAWV